MFSNYLEDLILNFAFRTAAVTRPTAWFVALSSTAPQENGTGVTEPGYTGYARQSATFGAPADAATGTSREISNTGALSFGDPDQNGSVTHFAVYDAASGGNMLAYGSLGATVNYQAGVADPISFPVGALKIRQD